MTEADRIFGLFPDFIKESVLDKLNIPYSEVSSLEDAMPELDVLYMTRVQQERFAHVEEYLRLKDSYILSTDKLETAKKDMIILHPLPRVNEISVAVDDDPRARYFEQTLNAKYMRMALILKLLGLSGEVKPAVESVAAELRHDMHCSNVRCITTTEQELPQAFRLTDAEKGVYRCIYCDTAAQ